MNDSELDTLIRTTMQPPYGLENRVATAVLEDCRRARRRRIWKITVAAAACLALFAGIFALRMPSASEPFQRLAIVLPPPPPLTESPALPATIVEPSQPLRLAGNAQSHRNSSAKATLPKELPSVVRHIWLVKDMDEAKLLLSHLAEDNHIPFRLDGNVAILGTTDQTAQSITDFLATQQWELLSPELPQPAQHTATRFTGKPVDYITTLTPMENKP